MPTESCYGVHATCMEYAPIIQEEGFKLSPDDRYFGAAVYFFENAPENIEAVNIHKNNKLKHRHSCAH